MTSPVIQLAAGENKNKAALAMSSALSADVAARADLCSRGVPLESFAKRHDPLASTDPFQLYLL